MACITISGVAEKREPEKYLTACARAAKNRRCEARGLVRGMWPHGKDLYGRSISFMMKANTGLHPAREHSRGAQLQTAEDLLLFIGNIFANCRINVGDCPARGCQDSSAANDALYQEDGE